LFVRCALRKVPRKDLPFARMAQLLLVRVVYEAIETDRGMARELERDVERRRGLGG